jgi:hypothetical protein
MAKIKFYGLVVGGQNPYKPFCKTESLESAKEIKGNLHNVDIIRYVGHRRKAHGRTILVIQGLG